MKKRDTIVEKNKKLKQQKKPEEVVPVLDNLESEITKDAEGNETTSWFLLKNPQFKHLNFCLNKLDDNLLAEAKALLERTPDNFCLTLAGNAGISSSTAQTLHQTCDALHKKRVAEVKAADPNA